jgi:hypothetical protein
MRLRQENGEFQASLGYIERPCLKTGKKRERERERERESVKESESRAGTGFELGI